MIFETPQGEARVVGTTLRLIVDTDPRKGTQLEVEEGKVLLKNLAGKSVPVESGHYAVAAAGAALVSKPVAVSFQLDLRKPDGFRSHLVHGEIVRLPTGPALRSMPLSSVKGKWDYSAGINYFDNGVTTFKATKTTQIRVRYFLQKAAPLVLNVMNATQKVPVICSFTPVVGVWTTVTIPVFELSNEVVCREGDDYRDFWFFVGKPGQEVEVLIDKFEVVETRP
jgi:hypothetical protein